MGGCRAQAKESRNAVHGDAQVGESEAQWKEREVRNLGADSVVAIGNSRNDQLMLRAAAIGIAILAPKGVATETQQAADLLAPDPISGLELLFHANRLKATLRLDTIKKN